MKKYNYMTTIIVIAIMFMLTSCASPAIEEETTPNETTEVTEEQKEETVETEASTEEIDNSPVSYQSISNFQKIEKPEYSESEEMIKDALEAVKTATNYYSLVMDASAIRYSSIEKEKVSSIKNPYIKVKEVRDSGYATLEMDIESFYKDFASKDCRLSDFDFSLASIRSYVELSNGDKVYTADNKNVTLDGIKILSGGNGIYKIGVVFNFDALNNATNDYVTLQYSGTATVVKEKDSWKIEDITTYYPTDDFKD